MAARPKTWREAISLLFPPRHSKTARTVRTSTSPTTALVQTSPRKSGQFVLIWDKRHKAITTPARRRFARFAALIFPTQPQLLAHLGLLFSLRLWNAVTIQSHCSLIRAYWSRASRLSPPIHPSSANADLPGVLTELLEVYRRSGTHSAVIGAFQCHQLFSYEAVAASSGLALWLVEERAVQGVIQSGTQGSYKSATHSHPAVSRCRFHQDRSS